MNTLALALQPLSREDVAGVLAVMLIIRLSRRAGMWVYALLGFPGTLAHEFAHYIVAFVLRAEPSWPSLVPRRTDRGWLLGAVAFRAGFLRRLPIAMAPLALAPAGLWWALTFLHAAPWPMAALHAWIAGALLGASLPSAQDVRLAWPAMLLLAAAAATVWLLR